MINGRRRTYFANGIAVNSTSASLFNVCEREAKSSTSRFILSLIDVSLRERDAPTMCGGKQLIVDRNSDISSKF